MEKSTVHWLPYQRILYHELADGTEEEECWDRPRAIEDFPTGWLTRKWYNFSWISKLVRFPEKIYNLSFFVWSGEQRLKGWFLIHIFIAIYFFIILAFICDKYFLPTVEKICEVLQISQVGHGQAFVVDTTWLKRFCLKIWKFGIFA